MTGDPTVRWVGRSGLLALSVLIVGMLLAGTTGPVGAAEIELETPATVRPGSTVRVEAAAPDEATVRLVVDGQLVDVGLSANGVVVLVHHVPEDAEPGPISLALEVEGGEGVSEPRAVEVEVISATGLEGTRTPATPLVLLGALGILLAGSAMVVRRRSRETRDSPAG